MCGRSWERRAGRLHPRRLFPPWRKPLPRRCGACQVLVTAHSKPRTRRRGCRGGRCRRALSVFRRLGLAVGTAGKRREIPADWAGDSAILPWLTIGSGSLGSVSAPCVAPEQRGAPREGDVQTTAQSTNSITFKRLTGLTHVNNEGAIGDWLSNGYQLPAVDNCRIAPTMEPRNTKEPPGRPGGSLFWWSDRS